VKYKIKIDLVELVQFTNGFRTKEITYNLYSRKWYSFEWKLIASSLNLKELMKIAKDLSEFKTIYL